MLHRLDSAALQLALTASAWRLTGTVVALSPKLRGCAQLVEVVSRVLVAFAGTHPLD
jgi:hypothetical protein